MNKINNTEKLTKNKILAYLKELKDEFKAKGIVSLALFGSYASDTENVYSDIDIAIKKEDDFLQNRSPYSYFETLNALKAKITKKLHRNVDILDLDSNSVFKRDIEKDLIYV